MRAVLYSEGLFIKEMEAGVSPGQVRGQKGRKGVCAAVVTFEGWGGRSG